MWAETFPPLEWFCHLHWLLEALWGERLDQRGLEFTLYVLTVTAPGHESSELVCMTVMPEQFCDSVLCSVARL